MKARALPLLLSSILVGCGGAVISDGPSDAEATKTSAVVVVERTAESAAPARVEVSARCVRVASSASVEDAWRAIGAGASVPPPGTCRPLTSLAGRLAADAPAPLVELLDVGGVSLEAGDASTRLLPRQLPDVTDVVSGVVYSRVTDTAFLRPGARYLLHVAGQPRMAGFDAAAIAPADPFDIHVSGEDAQGNVAVPPSGTTALEVTWPAPPSPGDVIYADLQPSAVRCALDDAASDGGVAHGSIPLLPLGDRGSIVLHRLRREPLHATGLADGEIRFDVARALAYGRR